MRVLRSLGQLVLLFPLSLAPAGAQSFLNLSFESAASNGVAAGWSTYSNGGAYQFALDGNTAVDGLRSLRIFSLTGTANQNGYAYASLPPFQAIGKTFHLSGFIRTQGAGASASLWVTVFDASNNYLGGGNSQTVSGTTGWAHYDMYLVVPSGAAFFYFGCQLYGSGTAWFDNLSIDLDGQSFFPDPTPQQVQWVQSNAIPFTTLDPNADFAELAPLKRMVGDAQIVGLGEGTHGTSEFFRMKSRLTSFLAREMGFTVFAIEANLPEAFRINHYITTGVGDPKELLRGMYFWTWNTQEVLDMIEWMRQYNASGQGTIQFTGFDMQTPNVAMDWVIRFVTLADPGLLATVTSTYNQVAALNVPTAATAANTQQYVAAQAAAQSLHDRLQANRDKYLQTMQASEVDWAIENAAIVVQAVAWAIAPNEPGSRDVAMEANVAWLRSQAPPGTRIVLWAHNMHISREPDWMGALLARDFGASYLPFGQCFHSGTYRAIGSNRLGTFPAFDSFPGSAEYIFHQTGTPQQILDLRLTSANNPAASWPYDGIEFRSIGAGEIDGINEFAPTQRLAADYDGLIFFDQTTASVELPYTQMDLAVFAPVVAPAETLGVPYAAAPAPGSGTATALPSGTAGIPYIKAFMGGGGYWPYRNWTLTGAALPAGLKLGTNGVLSGTPTVAGTFTFMVQTTDSSGKAAQGQATLTIHAASAPNAFVTTSATAGQIEPFAAESIVSAYGSNLAMGTLAAGVPVPTILQGTVVTVTDSAGATRLAPLFSVSPGQVNYEIPAGTAPGAATVIITNRDGVSQTQTIQVGNVSPGLFQLNGAGLVAAWVLPVVAGAQKNLQPVYQANGSDALVALPIDVGAADTQFYLEMYGTGIRNAATVTVTVGGVSVPVLYHGAALGWAGLDQVNIGPLPVTLAGAGSVPIVLNADGQAGNTVNVTIE